MTAEKDIAVFAELSARWDDPFADRTELLRAAGLDEARWVRLQDYWRSRMASNDAAAMGLAAQFGTAYAGARGGRAAKVEPSSASMMATAATPPTTPPATPMPVGTPLPTFAPEAAVAPAVTIPSFLKERAGREAQPLAREPLAQAPLAALQPAMPSLASETTEIDVTKLFAGRIPFNPSAPSAAAVASVAPKPKAPMSGETTDVDVAALARAALAFGRGGQAPSVTGAARPGRGRSRAGGDIPVPAGTPATAPTVELPAMAPTASLSALPDPIGAQGAPPGKRLVRFDRQTGQPLTVPYWEDLPSTSEPGGRSSK